VGRERKERGRKKAGKGPEGKEESGTSVKRLHRNAPEDSVPAERSRAPGIIKGWVFVLGKSLTLFLSRFPAKSLERSRPDLASGLNADTGQTDFCLFADPGSASFSTQMEGFASHLNCTSPV